MPSYSEPAHALDFLVSEANGHLSREQVTLTAAQGDLVAGTVMAKVTATGNYVPYDDDLNATVAGAGIAAGVLAYPAPNNAATQLITIIARQAEVQDELLVWEASNDTTEINAGKAELIAAGIIVRNK